MHAIMLAAGRGIRLSNGAGHPKCLLEFGGKTLLRRHIEILESLGIDRLTIVVGFKADEIHAELAAIGPRRWIDTVFNPRFDEGAVVSLWTARDVLRGGSDILFMDADVLYDRAVMRRLIESPHRNCLLIDRDLEPGPEPVKACLRDGQLVEFGKIVAGQFDAVGEWPGCLKLSPQMAGQLAVTTEKFVKGGRAAEPYEPAMREVFFADPDHRVGCEDITGMDWIEIDTPEDLRRAHEVIEPALHLR
jgi:choline kinase